MAMELRILFLFGFLTNYAFAFGDHSVQYIGPNILSEGDHFTLTCITPFHDTTSWVLNGSIVITDENLLGFQLMERELYSYYREMLLITVSAQLFHTGAYRCNGDSKDFHFVRVVEDLEAIEEEVTELPTIKQKRDDREKYPKRYYLDPNTDYDFACETKNKDYPVVWYKNMRLIDAFTAPNLELYDNYLIIHNAQLEDVGDYHCRLDADYQTGNRDVVSRYLLTSPTQIVDISEKQNVIRGRSMTIYCRARGYPAPKISWYIGNLNAYMLKEKDLRISIYSKREKYANAYLTLRNVTYLDRGTYTCRAENGIALGTDNKYEEKSISVYVRDNIIEPNEDEPGMGKILTPEKDLTLECKIEECPYCSFVWFKEGEKLALENNSNFQINEFNNSLTIHSPTINHTGLYECAVDREMVNVDLRATIKVRTCEDFLLEGLAIESICEIPVEESGTSSLHKQSRFLVLLILTSMWKRYIL